MAIRKFKQNVYKEWHKKCLKSSAQTTKGNADEREHIRLLMKIHGGKIFKPLPFKEINTGSPQRGECAFLYKGICIQVADRRQPREPHQPNPRSHAFSALQCWRAGMASQQQSWVWKTCTQTLRVLLSGVHLWGKH